MRRVLHITNEKGLHARAAARFVKIAERFDATVKVMKDGATVPGDSILGLMMLAAGSGSKISIGATGPDAKAVLDALVILVENRFNED